MQRTSSQTEGWSWHSVIAPVVIYGPKQMHFGTCNVIAEINKAWPEARAQNSCCKWLARGKTAAAGFPGSPFLWSLILVSLPQSRASLLFPDFMRGFTSTHSAPPQLNMIRHASFSLSKSQTESNHYFSIVSCSGWVINITGHVEPFLSQMGKGFHACLRADLPLPFL